MISILYSANPTNATPFLLLNTSFSYVSHAPAVLDAVERLTAEEMDERRQQNMAYEYLCHLEEAKRFEREVRSAIRHLTDE